MLREANVHHDVTARYGHNDETINKLLKIKTAETAYWETIRSRVETLSRGASECSVRPTGQSLGSQVKRLRMFPETESIKVTVNSMTMTIADVRP